MLGLQAAIGALNDVVDAPRDAGLKPGKPIPAGLVTPGAGLLVAAVAASAGVALSLPSGPATVLLALSILAIGGVYDLALKGTPLSWLPFAIGIPLLPVFGWLGATGDLPGAFVVLLPAAFLAGLALAVANALADLERDVAAGVSSIAIALGRVRAWRVHVAAHAVVLALAVGSLMAMERPGLAISAATGLPALLVAGGAWLALSPDARRRERGWELEAIGIAVLGSTWLVLALPR
jgi:4-hydroxybenzoate polyprenyltransferase